MTPDEARKLQPGDPVTSAAGPSHPGRVLRLIGNCVVIRWPSGAEVYYALHAMPYIERVTEPTHDPD